MSYVLRETIGNQYYCKDHNKIIEFETPELAQNFFNAFSQYAMAMAMHEMQTGNPELIFNVQKILQSTVVDEKPESGICEYITYEDILRSKGL